MINKELIRIIEDTVNTLELRGIDEVIHNVQSDGAFIYIITSNASYDDNSFVIIKVDIKSMTRTTSFMDSEDVKSYKIINNVQNIMFSNPLF